MNVQRIETDSAETTRRTAQEFAAVLRPGDLITVSGPLGAGKTTFVQGLAHSLGCESPVTSPTFVLLIEHAGRVPLIHVDAYRLENLCYDAIRDTGVTDAIERGDAVIVIEWPERIQDFLPCPRFAITLTPGDGDKRWIEIVSQIAS
jgi:tRNA threonylcarbamoyladenosine biosynthesis protein TsaE